MPEESVINKTMDRSDLTSDQARKIIAELGALISDLNSKGLKISSWYGCFELSGNNYSSEVINRGYNYKPIAGSVDDKLFPWFLLWEIVWVIINADFIKGQKILDLGGSSSLFSYYLAANGLEVVTIDLQKKLVENANLVAGTMKWNLKNYVMDMNLIEFDSNFDHITSICVYEHIPMYKRIKINKRIANLLPIGGRFSITFDYKNPSRLAMINTPIDVYQQFIKPSGLNVRGNNQFIDNGKCYLLHPFFHKNTPLKYKLSHIIHGHLKPWEIFKSKKENDYTFGALFLEK